MIRHQTIEASVFCREGLFGNRYVLTFIAAVLLPQIGFTDAWPMHAFFSSESIGIGPLVSIIALGSVVLIVAEFDKDVYKIRQVKAARAGAVRGWRRVA